MGRTWKRGRSLGHHVGLVIGWRYVGTCPVLGRVLARGLFTEGHVLTRQTVLIEHGYEVRMEGPNASNSIGRIGCDNHMLETMGIEFEFERDPTEFRRIELDPDMVGLAVGG